MSAATGTSASTTTEISSEIWLSCPVLMSLSVPPRYRCVSTGRQNCQLGTTRSYSELTFRRSSSNSYMGCHQLGVTACRHPVFPLNSPCVKEAVRDITPWTPSVPDVECCLPARASFYKTSPSFRQSSIWQPSARGQAETDATLSSSSRVVIKSRIPFHELMTVQDVVTKEGE